MKRKLFTSIIAVAVAIMALFTTAYAETGDVEIRFSVGDDILTINGEQVQVEKPYIVGDGVTLVPVRVITEAFGAKVDWDQPTKTVTLDYPDVNIILQIDNKVAEVNGKAVDLESAPELTDAGFTMVPLRFISENFGADVSYDHATAGIVVTKSATNEGNIVEGAVDSEFIGDSFYNWYMETPDDMIMDTRYFDGTYTSFSYDENNWISVSIYSRPEDFNLDEEFKDTRSYFSNYTITKADKETLDDGVQYIHIQAKDKNAVVDCYEYITDTYLYCINGGFDGDDTQVRDECMRIIETFTLGFGDDVYDLSNAKDGVRTFKVENMKLSFNVPDEFIMLNDEDAENSFYFCSGLPDDDDSMIMASIYSKSSSGDAKSLAKKDYESNKADMNEELVTFSNEVTTMNYKNITAYQYEYEVDSKYKKLYCRDVFFEVGEYVYNFGIVAKLPHENVQKFANDIVNSIVAEELDPNEVGTIIYTYGDEDGPYVADALNKFEMTLPGEFYAISESKTTAVYTNGAVVIVANALMDEDYTSADMSKIAESTVTSQRKIEGVNIKQMARKSYYGKNECYFFSYKYDDKEMVTYCDTYMLAKNKIGYVIKVVYPELAYSEDTRNQVNEIIASITLK